MKMQGKMFYFWSIFLVAVVIKTSCGAIVRKKPEAKPEEFADQEGCYSRELNAVIPFNEKYTDSATTLGMCGQYLCQENGAFVIHTCGAVAAGTGSKIVDGDMTASYPDCCPKIVPCRDDQHSATC